MEERTYSRVDSLETLDAAIKRVRAAQKLYASYSQEQVDACFTAAAIAADKMRLPLAEMAVSETGMGVVEDKVIKNHYAAEYIYNAYRDTKTCGVIEEDKAFGIKKNRRTHWPYSGHNSHHEPHVDGYFQDAFVP